MTPPKTVPTLAMLREKRADILALAARYGASNVRVFGSVARGDATPDSDVDLLVEQDWTRLSSWGGMGFMLDLEDLLQRKVDVVTLEELKPHVKRAVLKEAVWL